MNNRHTQTSLEKYLPLTLLQGFEKVVWGFTVRGSWRPNRNCNILTPLWWPSTLCLSRSHAQPEVLGSTLLGAGFLYCILSASSLDPNSSGPQAPSAWCGFPYHISSITPFTTVCNPTDPWLTSWLLNNSSTPTWSPTRSLKLHV